MIVGATVGELPVVKEAFRKSSWICFSSFPLLLSLCLDKDISGPQVYQIYILGYSDNDCLCFCYQQGDGEFRSGRRCGAFHYRMSHHYGPHVLLAAMFIITNLFTELITNNAAAALAFPLALSISSQMGVSPMPFFVVICMALPPVSLLL